MTGENREKIAERISRYSDYLSDSDVPKLMLYSTPGFINTIGTVEWCSSNFPNLQLGDLDDGGHIPQESNSQIFGQLLRDWYAKI